jgi:serine-type D-Ala-D-Ala carboxypeptidase/endopeptidase (penicillin-binding protein 4)
VPRRLLAPLPIVLCALFAAWGLAPGTTASATVRLLRAPAPDSLLHSLAAVRARAAAQPHPAPRATRAAAGAVAALQGHLTHELGLAGALSGGYVYDMSSGQVLFSERAQDRRTPASVEKLYTATTALERWGPGAQLETTVLGAGHLAAGGVWEGNLYLHGGGDPTFGTEAFIRSHYGGVGTAVSTLAAQLVHTDGIHRVTGTVEGDESYFDSLRGEPSSGYAWDPFLEGTLSALAFNRGETGSERGPHAPGAYAARRLRAALRAAGVVVPGPTHPGGAATTPPGTVRLAAAPSPTIAQLLGLTLPPSDNFFAETLLKGLGARFGGAGTTAAGAHVVRETIAELGLHPQVVDGSGLSTEDQTSPYEVVTLLDELAHTPLGTILRGDLAVAGHTGTLSERMRGTAAEGRCEGKTGTLTGISNLVGYCTATGGDELAFAFFTDGLELAAAHTLQDNMAITLADY